MKFIDMHCDTLSLLLEAREKGDCNHTLWSNGFSIDGRRLLKGKYAAQNFACYADMLQTPVSQSHYEDYLQMIGILKEFLLHHEDNFALAMDYDSYRKNKERGKISTFLTVEDAFILEGDLSRMQELSNQGVYMMGLTWNYENEIGYPNCISKFQERGLKKIGFEVLAQMDELGIIVDVSHLSDGGFYDVIAHGKRPFVASHSNARGVRNHCRNLTDDMIRKIADRGGIIGLNFYGAFLNDREVSTYESMAEHIKHMVNIGGDEVIAIGTDWDGIDTPTPMKDCGCISEFVDAMERLGISNQILENTAYKNFERFLSQY